MFNVAGDHFRRVSLHSAFSSRLFGERNFTPDVDQNIRLPYGGPTKPDALGFSPIFFAQHKASNLARNWNRFHFWLRMKKFPGAVGNLGVSPLQLEEIFN